MSRKIILLLVSLVLASFLFSCAGGGVSTEMLVGEYSSASNGTIKFMEDNTLELMRANGNKAAEGTWESGAESLTLSHMTLYDTEGENPYEELVNYEYYSAYSDGTYFAPISATGGSELEGEWNVGMVKRYDMSREGEPFLALEIGMTFVFGPDTLSIKYDLYKEYTDTGDLVYDAVAEGEAEEVIPYTVEGNVIKLANEPFTNFIFAGGRIGDPATIDFKIVEGTLLLYSYEK